MHVEVIPMKILPVSLDVMTFRACLRPCIAALALLVLASCAAGARLDTVAADPRDAEGTFTLYLHGCRYFNDIENMALLADSTAPYRFDLFASPTVYRTKTGVAGSDAVAEARAFFRCNINDTGRILMRRIVGPSGRTIAFELKPLYTSLEMGADEVLLSDYFLHGNEVRVHFRLDPDVERMQRFDIPGLAD
jgi:hypothetical protein